MFICPICRLPLAKSGGAYVCGSGHSFDISRRGYVNLLRSQSSKTHGDDKTMSQARRSFLNRGYYRRLRDCICKLTTAYPAADICCGEGYYLEGLSKPGCSVVGTDISKAAVDYAARRSYEGEPFLAVANCMDLPLADESIGTAVSVFAPLSESEIARILKKDGKLIRVLPGRDHLIELKRAVYDNAKYNPPDNALMSDLKLCSAENLRYSVHLADGSDVRSLFTMTPYYYRTDHSGMQRLREISSLDLTLHFYIYIYKKI